MPRADAGPPSARTRLVEEHFNAVYALCFRILGHPHDAEDATQETFLALFRDLPKLARAESPRAWALAVARNVAVSHGRARRGATPLVEGLTEAPPIAEPVDRDRLRRALAQLSEADRHLLELRFLEGKGAAELAAATGRSAGALAVALCRALQRLREVYR